MKFASFLPLALVLCLYGSTPVAADPVVFPFSVRVTTASGPLEDLFGRSFQSGDELTGRVTFDGTSGPDQAPADTHGTFDVPSGRIELDVPSGFALDAGHMDTFTADTFNDFRRGQFDELIFSASTCCHSSGIGFVVADVLWTDTTKRALTSDSLPTDPAVLQGFQRAAFGLVAGDQNRITLFGESAPLTPVPEPGTLVLMLTGLAAVSRRQIGRLAFPPTTSRIPAIGTRANDVRPVQSGDPSAHVTGDHQPDFASRFPPIQTLNTPLQEDRGVVEFGIPAGLTPASATLDLPVLNSLGPFPLDIGVFGYGGDGTVTLSDFEAGTQFASFLYDGQSSIQLDVTPVIESLLASGAPVVGFGFHALEESPIRENGPFVAFSSASLDIVASGPAPVPEPATLLLAGTGAAYLLHRRRSFRRADPAHQP